MSVEAITWAFARDDVPTTTAKFILVALANSADTYGVTFLGQKAIAKRCGIVVETVSRNMTALENAGLIRCVERRRANGSKTSDWTVLAPGYSDRGAMDNAPAEEFPSAVVDLACRLSIDPASSDAVSVGHLTQTGGPEPSVEPSVSREGARTRGLAVRYGGKKVALATVDAAEALLGVFNTEMGRSIGARSSSGQPSPDCKQIIGALLARPEVLFAEWERAVRHSISNPPGWCDGRKVNVGDIFGEKAAGHALVNDGKQKSGAMKSGERREPTEAVKAKYKNAGW